MGDTESVDGALQPPPPVAAHLLGDRLGVMTQYAEILAGDGVIRGLIGPREAPRLWDRHLLNCAAIGELLPDGATVIDVGSGAGLPGIVLACARADLRLVLVDPLERRTAFLAEAAGSLGIGDRVSVVRGRIDDRAVRDEVGPCAWMTARAVAPLAKLAEWCAAVLAPGGRLLAMKGERAAEELSSADGVLRKRKLAAWITSCGAELLEQPTTVVVVERPAR